MKKEAENTEPNETTEDTEKKHASITGECIFCHTFREVDYYVAMARATLDKVDLQNAADRISTDICNCKQGVEFRKRKERLENAAGYLKKVFAENESAAQMSMCAIKAVDEHAVDKVTFKIDKYAYTIDKDKDNMLRVKTKFTDGQEATF